MEQIELGKQSFLGFMEQQHTAFSSSWNQTIGQTPSGEASTALSQSSSSVVISNGASFSIDGHGHSHAGSIPCESSGQSGSVLKEHDYIGLAEVSSSCSSVNEDDDAHTRDLNLEDTDLRLGLGPLKEDLAPSNVIQNKAQPPLELKLLEPTDKGPQPDKTLATPQGAHLVFMNAFTSAAMAPSSKNGVKRVYSDALGEAKPSPNMTSAAAAAIKQPQGSESKTLPEHAQNVFLSNWALPKPNGLYSNLNDKSRHDELQSYESASTEPPPAKGQVVGWPPIRSYRKNTLATTHAGHAGDEGGDGQSTIYVKVNMDGMPIGRKVDLNAYLSYENLLAALEEMFHSSSGGHGLHFLSNSEFVLTYEDKEGDWMLVGDVPWGMFVNTVRRLRIVRGSEATGLAPRSSKCHA